MGKDNRRAQPRCTVLCPPERCSSEKWSDLALGFPGVEVVLRVASSKISPQHPTEGEPYSGEDGQRDFRRRKRG